MNLEEKEKIKKLRLEGLGYKKISNELGISINTVKSFCRNNNLTSEFTNKKVLCKQCGQEIIQKEHIKKKLFCSEVCKRKWWNKNRANLEKTSLIEHTCLNCHKVFRAYPKDKRKYCSHECYINSRFKGGDGNE